MGKESHWEGNKDRTFVRAIAGRETDELGGGSTLPTRIGDAHRIDAAAQ